VNRAQTAGEPLARRTRRILAQLGHRPRRSRGQSFLIDPSVAERIVSLVADSEPPQVLEVGAGLAALTDLLSARATRVVAVELDQALASALEGILEHRANVRVVCTDALEADLAALCDGQPDRWRVVGNLPYYAATAILLRLLSARPPFERIVATVQREVGERLLASPGDADYGSLTVVTAYHAEHVRAAARVPRGAFYPQPKVDSTVLVLQPRRVPLAGIASEDLLLRVVRAGFAHRRKQLANSLGSAPSMSHIDRETAREALTRAGVGEKCRAQELSLGDFVRVANALWETGVRPVGAD
jgi:16S rRNA (adenine1518-N6/adenine1519-N6)-dimethyltransferase